MKTVKANSQEKRFYKLLVDARKRVENLLDNFVHGDRDGYYISFNCKVYGVCLSSHELPDYLRTLGLTAIQYRHVLREFTQSRLYNIYNHMLHDAADQFKDQFSGMQTTPLSYIRSIKETIAYSFPDCSAIQLPFLERSLRRAKDLEAAFKRIDAFFAESRTEYAHGQLMNTDEVFQFGRSSGHFALAPADEFNEYLSQIDIALKFFSLSGETLYVNEIENVKRSDFFYEVEMDSSLDDRALTHIIGRSNAVLYFIKEGQKVVAALRKKEAFLSCLRHEIDEFISGISFKITPKMEQEFIAGTRSLRTNGNMLSLIRKSPTNPKVFETSQGVTVPVVDGLTLYQELIAATQGKKPVNLHGRRIGNFIVENFYQEGNDWILKAGCHRISLNHIERALASA